MAATGGALMVGSIPLRSTEDVFRTVAGALGDRLRRIPDGETGPRSDWIVWQYPVLNARPQFEVCPRGTTRIGRCRDSVCANPSWREISSSAI